MAALLPPVPRQCSAGLGQQMTGQIGHTHPGQDQKARVIAQEPEVALPPLPIPPDKGVTALCFPGSRSKQHTAQRMACLIPNQVLEVLSHAITMAKVMIAMQQELEQEHVVVGFPQRFNPQRPQGAQIPFNRTAIMGHFGDLTVATGVGGRSLAGRKPDLAQFLQLQQKRAAGHVLEPPLLVAPVPSFAQIPREPATVPRRVLRQQTPDYSHFTRRNAAPLNDFFRLH